ncbi:MAG: YncE family protein, partial [Acidobacteriaceae bacterium]
CDGGKMAVVDSTSGKTLANPAIGDGPDAARYDGQRKLAFSSNGAGTLTIIDANKSSYPVLQNLTTQRGARTMTLDEVSGHIFLATASFGEKPAPTEANPRPRPAVLPGSFTILVVGRK